VVGFALNVRAAVDGSFHPERFFTGRPDEVVSARLRHNIADLFAMSLESSSCETQT